MHHAIELTQFDIINPGDIRAAYELGVTDGEALAFWQRLTTQLSEPCFGRGCREHLF